MIALSMRLEMARSTIFLTGVGLRKTAKLEGDAAAPLAAGNDVFGELAEVDVTLRGMSFCIARGAVNSAVCFGTGRE